MQRLALALMPLRLFLGGTFVYAGVQKLSDPGFLHPGAPTYIGTQLEGFANGTPGGFILRAFAIPIPEVAGVGVALTEILIGLLVLLGLYTRWAAAGGMGLNLLLFLTASWHTTPYFLGPDLVFTFAWSPFVIAGAEGQPALDTAFEARRRRFRGGPEAPHRVEPIPGAYSRRAALLELGGLAVAIAGVSALAKGSFTPARAIGARKPRHGSGSKSAKGGGEGGQAGAEAAGPAKPTAGSSVPANAVELAGGSELPAGSGATYPDPVSGEPDILIRASDGRLTAFSAVCTHAGCTVGYENGVIFCPCHGGEYDPNTGAVIAGPPPAGLEPKKVIEAGGKLYAVPS
ncbi:MAG TPA: TQO small subunit DoxD [Solirubrobacterales bacterium]